MITEKVYAGEAGGTDNVAQWPAPHLNCAIRAHVLAPSCEVVRRRELHRDANPVGRMAHRYVTPLFARRRMHSRETLRGACIIIWKD